MKRRAVSGAAQVNLAYPNEYCRGCHQPFWAYALPKTENYLYRLLGTTALLACLAADDEPAGFKTGYPTD